MISLLIGTIAHKQNPYIILNVHGVGYKVFVGSTVLSRLDDGEIIFHTYLHVRDDALDLYGFLDPADLKLFEYLIGVSGVGCKTAMGVFSVGKRQDIINAVVKGDVSFFLTVPRLGKKNAQKLIIELKSKLGSTEDFDLTEGETGNETLVAALKQFGYSMAEIQAALKEIGDVEVGENEKIRLALKYLGRGK